MSAVLEFIKAYWKPLTGLLLLAVTFFAGYHLGAAHIKDFWDKAVAKAAAQSVATEEKGNHISEVTENDLQQRIDSINSAYQFDLGSLYTPRSGLPQTTGAAPSHHAETGANGLSGADKKRLLELARLADIQTAQLQGCQDWITAQEKIYGTHNHR